MTTRDETLVERCEHDLTEREVAVSADGYCPLCMSAEIARLTAQVSDNVAMLDRAARDCVSLTDRALSAERAIEAEREACAMVADKQASVPVDSAMQRAHRYCAHAIAAAIRNRNGGA